MNSAMGENSNGHTETLELDVVRAAYATTKKNVSFLFRCDPII